MSNPSVEITRIVFGTLFSLSVFGISTYIIDLASEKAPWDTKKTKIVVLIILAIVCAIVLTAYFRKNQKFKTNKAIIKYGLTPDQITKGQSPKFMRA